jgi:RHS repeat-associated protein
MKSLYRILLISFIFCVISLAGWAQQGSPCPPCDNKERGPEKICPSCGTSTNSFDPYTGNVNHDVKDLDVWGSVGEEPLTLMRYGNSRSVVSPWQLNFHYLLFDGGTNGAGQPQLELYYPEGNRDVFAQYGPNPTWWLPIAGVGERIFQYGNNFFLQLPNGYRYRFEKMVINGVTEYRLMDFKDQFQNEYKITYDDVNRKKRIIEPAGRYIELQFTNRSFNWDPVSAVTSDGRRVQYIYDTLDDGIRKHIRLRSVLYGDGTKAMYEYTQQAPGLPFVLSHAIDPRVRGVGTNMKYTYVSYASGIAGLVYQEINGKTNQVMATLDGNSEDRKVKYANGRIQILNMPDSQMSNVNRYTDGVGATTEYTYYDKGLGFIKAIKDPLGRVTTFDSMTIYGNPLQITHPDGSKEQWFRDTLDLVLRYIDQLGRATTYTRDSRHRPVRIDYPDGRYETFTYNNFSEVLDHRKRNGCIEHFTYDSRGLKTSFTDCAGNVTSYGYDAVDRLAVVINARGKATNYQYSERGLLTNMMNPDSSIQTYKYDEFGNRDTVINELGKIWTTTYDEFKRPITKTDPLGRTTAYSYDLPGGVCGCAHEKNNPTKITLPSGRINASSYDVEWRKIGDVVGAGSADAATTNYQYDLVGNLIKTIDPNGQSWTTTYDVMNREKTTANPLGNTTQWTYDAAGNILSAKRPDGGTTNYVYDPMNRVKQTTDPKGQVTQWVYDDNGNVMRMTDPKGNSYTFGHDVLDRLTYMTYPGGSVEKYSYDPVGNVITFQNRKGNIRTYTYDSRNREILSDWNDATPDVATTYDVAGRVLTKTSSVSVLSYTYNGANELLSETQNIAGGSGPKTITYTYNADGFYDTKTYPAGNVVSYTYSGRNQIASIRDGAPVVANYTYDPNDNRLTKALENGTIVNYGYDFANRMLNDDNKKGATSFAKFNYGYDIVDRRTYVQYDNAKGDVYSYDAIDQVTDVKYDVTNPDGTPGTPARAVNYVWDPAGNRTTVTDNAVPTAYTTNNLNQYATIGSTILHNDGNGSLDSMAGWKYTYDAQNRLIKAVQGTNTFLFQYDARNRCVKKTFLGSPSYFYYDEWSLIEERDAGGVLINRYVNGAMMDEILKKVSPANTIYYHHDALGNVVRLTDNAGNVVEKYAYDVFGAPTIKNAAGTVISISAYGNRFMFTGREYISQIGLYDYRNRMYSASLGRFLQTDPIGFAAGDYNLYGYVWNNPMNWIDAYGLWYMVSRECGQEHCDNTSKTSDYHEGKSPHGLDCSKTSGTSDDKKDSSPSDDKKKPDPPDPKKPSKPENRNQLTISIGDTSKDTKPSKGTPTTERKESIKADYSIKINEHLSWNFGASKTNTTSSTGPKTTNTTENSATTGFTIKF